MSYAETALQVLSALAAFAAAYSWWKSTVVFFPAPERLENALGVTVDGGVSVLIKGHRAALYETLELQSKWNARGAIWAAAAAGAQGSALLIGLL